MPDLQSASVTHASVQCAPSQNALWQSLLAVQLPPFAVVPVAVTQPATMSLFVGTAGAAP